MGNPDNPHFLAIQSIWKQLDALYLETARRNTLPYTSFEQKDGQVVFTLDTLQGSFRDQEDGTDAVNGIVKNLRAAGIENITLVSQYLDPKNGHVLNEVPQTPGHHTNFLKLVVTLPETAEAATLLRAAYKDAVLDEAFNILAPAFKSASGRVTLRLGRGLSDGDVNDVLARALGRVLSPPQRLEGEK